MSQSVLRVVLVAAVGVGCDVLTEDFEGSKPNPVAPAPVPVVVVVVAVPTPTPAPPPQPAPTATPDPPSAQGCRLPPGNGPGTNCPRQQSSYLRQVESAADQLIRDEPGMFDLKRTRGCGECYLVTDPDRYSRRMAELMAERNLCGHNDGEELAVKGTNAFNDQYDILTADMFMRRQEGSYRSTCYPAWF
ncbi:MAG TPA: hypothetical protein VMT87_11690 [Vicinamibacteria bacterium]|nr:hypothetical protein [Vicinamibacteria bacterium]